MDFVGKIQVFRHPYWLYYLYWVEEAPKGGQEEGVEEEGGREEEGVAFSNYKKWILLEKFEYLDTHIDFTIFIE